MPSKGLIRFSIQPRIMPADRAGMFSMAATAMAAPNVAAPQESFIAAARRHLNTAFNRAAPAGFASPQAEADAALTPELTDGKVEEIPLTQTTVAQFSQEYRGIPVFGAQVGVEMAQNRDLLGISGHLAQEPDADPVATLSPAQALKAARKEANVPEDSNADARNAPELMYWYDAQGEGHWRLAYVFSYFRAYARVPEGEKPDRGTPSRVVIDAHDGSAVAIIPMRFGLTAAPAHGLDDAGHDLQFTAARVTANQYVLVDPARKIKTYSMDFSDVTCGPLVVPGNAVKSNNAKFDHPAAVAAHFNATQVYDFYLNVLKRQSIDGHGMDIVSTVHCVDYRYDGVSCTPAAQPPVTEFENAFWTRDPAPANPVELRTGMMFYGQVKWDQDGKLHTFSEALDVVGHELTHGVTEYSGGLEYVTDSGALNESMSDIFGLTISNANTPDVRQWNWELGEELSPEGHPLRNMADPAKGNPPQPVNMTGFKRLPPGVKPSGGRYGNDMGYVHHNSGIHNKAAYNMFQRPEFTWQQVIQLFYLTLTTPGRLHPLATFSDSLAGMVASCASLFRNDPALDAKVAAVRAAFGAVGIV